MPDTPEPAAILRAPWTPEQVHALNAYQSGSGMHPFTCGRDHGGQAVALIAHTDGWHCSEPPCAYRQDWALAFMADLSTWPGTRRLHGLLGHVGIAQPSPETPAPVPGPDPTLQDRVAEAPGPAPAAAGTLGPLWTAMASAIAALPVPPPPHPDRDRRDRVAAALLARIKQATVARTGPDGQIGSIFAATEYDLADTVLAELAPELARAELGDRPRQELAALAVNAANALRDEKRHYAIACEEITRLRQRLEDAHTEGARLARLMGDMRRERDDERRRAEEAEAEVRRMRHFVAASGEPGHAVRVAATATQRVEELEAALARVQAVAKRWERDAPPPGNRPLTDLLRALDAPAEGSPR